MTVGELIKELQKYDLNAEVLTDGCYTIGPDIVRVNLVAGDVCLESE